MSPCSRGPPPALAAPAGVPPAAERGGDVAGAPPAGGAALLGGGPLRGPSAGGGPRAAAGPPLDPARQRPAGQGELPLYPGLPMHRGFENNSVLFCFGGVHLFHGQLFIDKESCFRFWFSGLFLEMGFDFSIRVCF